MDKEIVIRKATASDKEDVLKINDHVYDGNDYLPAYYDYFLSSMDIIPLVVVIDGKIVGFAVEHFVEDGHTIVGRAGRLNPLYERKGYVKIFNDRMDDWRRQQNAKIIAFTATDANPLVPKRSFQVNRRILTCQMPLYCSEIQKIRFSEADIQQSLCLNVASEIHLSRYFRSQEISKYLSPQGRMIVDMVPLKMIDANIRHMKGPDGYTSVFSDIRIEKGKCSGLLSFGTVFPVQRSPFHCNLDIFGSDTTSLKQHITRHIVAMQPKVEGVVAILVMVQEDYDMQKLDEVFEDFGIKRTIWYDSKKTNVKYSQLYMYERDLYSSKY